MPGRSFGSGAFRFALVIAAVFAAGSALLLAVVEHSIGVYAGDATAGGLASETRIFADELADGGRAELLRAIGRHQRIAGGQPYRYLLLDADGRRIAGDLPMSAARPGRSVVTLVDDPVLAGRPRESELLQSLGTRLADGSLLVVATDTYDIFRLRERLRRFSIGWGAAITLLALAGGYLIGGVLLRRLERVNAAVARIMAGSLSERLPPIGMSPEFNYLSSNLNAMLDRISVLMEGLRQISTDIAHDLRTPLTRLRQQLETMQGATTLEASTAGVESALTQIDEILAIFRALLRIGTLESGVERARLQRTSLSEVADRVAQLYRPVAEDESRPLRVDITPDVDVLGDRELLTQVFANLLDNAMKYSDAGATITVGVHRGADGAAVALVADTGPGVPETERAKILRRFYRVDASRQKPGAGLGLALAAAIAGLHQATLAVEDNAPGLRVRMVFPRLPDRPAVETAGPDDAARTRAT